MKTITATKTVYTLDELSDTACRNALEKMSACLYEWIEPDQITEYLNGELFTMLTGECVGDISSKELTKRVGLVIEWSLSCRQGDGVAIYGGLSSDDAPKLEWHNAQKASLTRNEYGNYYSHYNTFDVEVFGEDECGHYTTLDGDTGEHITEQFRDICHKLTRMGYDQIEYLTNNEAIREHLDMDNPRRFTEDGDIIHPSFWGEQ